MRLGRVGAGLSVVRSRAKSLKHLDNLNLVPAISLAHSGHFTGCSCINVWNTISSPESSRCVTTDVSWYTVSYR